MQPRIAIVYHSAFGHTAKVAEAVAEGASGRGADVVLLEVDVLNDAGWQALDEADAIIFGCPTYMGGVTARYKEFIDGTSKRWFEQRWKDKIAAGFTNSGSYSGDKLSALVQLTLNAMQHGMIWVGTALLPPMGQGTDGPGPNEINRLGSYLGLMTQASNDSPEITPPPGDLRTAQLFGERVAEIAMRYRRDAA